MDEDASFVTCLSQSAAGLQAADNVIYMREAIEAISQRHGLTATFLPKPREHWAGSGAHTHFSMQDSSGENLMGRLMDGLQGEGSLAESFIAGLSLARGRAYDGLTNNVETIWDEHVCLAVTSSDEISSLLNHSPAIANGLTHLCLPFRNIDLRDQVLATLPVSLCLASSQYH